MTEGSFKIKCCKCGNEYFIGFDKPANLSCQKCGGILIILFYPKEGDYDFIAQCTICKDKKEFKIPANTPVFAFHDIPNCKAYLLRIVDIKERVIQSEQVVKKTVESILEIKSEIPKKEEIKKITPKNSVIELSIIVLCHDLLNITKKCIEHIRKLETRLNYEIILLDNASIDGTEAWASEEQKISKGFVYIRNQINLGCVIGRNQAVKWAKGDYLLFLDNDQYIPPSLVDRQMALKCDIVGVEHWQLIAADGRVSRKPDLVINDLSYVGSGGMLIKKSIFQKLGGFDERFAPAWYEDPDLCFRAKRFGYSIAVLENPGIQHLGNSTIRHQTNFKQNSEGSQKVFSTIWKDALIDKKFPVMEIPYKENEKKSLPAARQVKPSILFIIDVYGWAWDFKTSQLKKYLSDEFEINIITLEEMSNRNRFMEKWGKGVDVYFTFESNFMESLWDLPGLHVSGITAHTYNNVREYRKSLSRMDAVHANSKMLFEELKKINSKCFYVPNGVDEKLFAFKEREIKGTFVAGYVGKSKPRKGFTQYIAPACAEAKIILKAQLCKWNDANTIDHHKIPDFYKEVDVILVASDMDGTPNQLLEGASVGRTFIGNRIGNIPEFVKNGINGFMVERDIDEYKEKLKFLNKNRNVCEKMGREARKTIEEGWTWKKQTENYRTMLRAILK